MFAHVIENRPGGQALFLAAWVSILGACATLPPYRWVDDVPESQDQTSFAYRVAARDVISVRVWNQESMSLERARVREDGKVSLPFLKDVTVVGMTPNELSEKIQQALVSFIVDPIMTVTLEEPAPLTISVVGEVTTAGAFTMPRPSGVLQAIASAGGLTPYADREGIYVLRRLSQTLPPVRIRFRYRDLTSGGTKAAEFVLQPGDVLVVE